MLKTKSKGRSPPSGKVHITRRRVQPFSQQTLESSQIINSKNRLKMNLQEKRRGFSSAAANPGGECADQTQKGFPAKWSPSGSVAPCYFQPKRPATAHTDVRPPRPLKSCFRSSRGFGSVRKLSRSARELQIALHTTADSSHSYARPHAARNHSGASSARVCAMYQASSVTAAIVPGPLLVNAGFGTFFQH